MNEVIENVGLFNYAPGGFFALDQRGLISNVNIAGAMVLGLQKDDLIRRKFSSFILDADKELFRSCIEKVHNDRIHQECEVRVVRLDGQRLWLKLKLIIPDEADLSEIVLTMSDITLQKRIELTHSFLLGANTAGSNKDFFETLVEFLGNTLDLDYVSIDRFPEKSTHSETVAVNYDGRIENNINHKLDDSIYKNLDEHSFFSFPNSVCDLFPENKLLKELEAESLAGITLRGSGGNLIGLIAGIRRTPFQDTNMIETVFKQVSIRAACELEHRRMEEVILRSRDQLRKIVQERTAELQKTVRLLESEIATRKQKEESLILAEEKYRTVADFTFDWETWFSTEGHFLYVSPSCEKITGYTVEEFMENPSLVIEITHPDDREFVHAHYQEKLSENQEGCSIDFRIITRDGKERWIGHSCQPVYDSTGRWIGQRGSNHDITDRKRTEQVLVDSKIHLRALMKHIDEVTEKERTRIAREIHDEMGHLLTSLKFDIEGLAGSPSLTKEMLKEELASISCVIDDLIRSVRKIATDLRPGILDHLGLIPALEWQLEQFCSRTGVSCDYDLSIEDESFSDQETTVIFRIFQEILTNIARHSKANKVKVCLLRDGQHIKIIINDNGIGFERKNIQPTKSLGLLGMRERALSVGGNLTLESAPGKGTRIIFSLPRN